MKGLSPLVKSPRTPPAVHPVAKSIGLAALSSVDQVELWRRHLLNEDPRVSIAALTYLTDHVAGKPSQVVQGDPQNPIAITLEWTTRPECLSSVTVNQQVNHISTSMDRAEEIRQLTDRQARPLK
jgi:hypothetical protein